MGSSSAAFATASIERHLRQQLASDRARLRFDRARRFIDQALAAASDDALAQTLNARWLKFLCGQAPVQNDIGPDAADVLRRFAADFGLPPAERRRFTGLSLLGWLWRAWSLQPLLQGPVATVARLTHVVGAEHFDRGRQHGAGLVLLPVHGQFSRLLQPYFRHRGHDGLELGITGDKLEQQGVQTSAQKQMELARQMHAAKRALDRGGIVFNLPDARQNLDNARTVEFFGRERPLAAGFAELALRTGAQVVPMAYRFSPRGFFVLEFGAPLRIGGPEQAHGVRVDSLVDQYADFLRDQWRRYPWNIPWPHLHHYCQLPAAVAGAINPRAQALPQ